MCHAVVGICGGVAGGILIVGYVWWWRVWWWWCVVVGILIVGCQPHIHERCGGGVWVGGVVFGVRGGVSCGGVW